MLYRIKNANVEDGNNLISIKFSSLLMLLDIIAPV